MKLTFTLILIVSMTLVKSQSAYDFIEGTNFKGRVNANGSLFYNSDSTSAGFEFPKDSEHYLIYFAGLNFSGLNASNDTLAAASYYYNDFQPGPIMDSIYYPFRAAYWNRVWKVTQGDINYHVMNFASPGYVMPSSIAAWPAHGDTTYGEPFLIAPFIDLNSNGIYEPLLGEYPKIMGTSGIFQVFNDDCVHIGTGGQKLKIEVRCLVYGFECTGSAALNNSAFIHYDIINRSSNNYYQCATALFTDYDVGYYRDDYTGCDVSRGLSYSYNADAYDDSITGYNGYGSKLPMIGTITLAGPLADADGFDNPIVSDYASMMSTNGIIYQGQGFGYDDGIVDNERLSLNYYNYFIGLGAPIANMSDPDYDYHNFYLMRGFWRNRVHLKTKSVGYPGLLSTDTLNSNYSFFGDSDPYFVSTLGVPTTNWNEFDYPNTAGDRRGFNSSGVFTFESHEIISLDYAIIAAIDSTADSSRLSAKPILLNYADSIRTYFNSLSTPCGDFYYSTLTGLNAIESKTEFKIYPNPNNGLFNIETKFNNEIFEVQITDIHAKTVFIHEYNQDNVQLNLDQLENGLYFIQLKNKTNFIQKPLVILK